jgi:hypothetical protein
MRFLSRLFARRQDVDSLNERMRNASSAISSARAGRLGVPEMLRVVLDAQVLVPLAAAPRMDENMIRSWFPATVSKEGLQKQFVVAFTDRGLAETFVKQNPQFPFPLLVDTRWVVSSLPAGHGIVFNLGSADLTFEWSAQGISEYQHAPPN